MMHVRSGLVALALWICGAAHAAPPLTTIDDVLYKADGTTFNGVAFIEWKNFQAADFSNIATHSVTAAIVNGRLRVQLVLTTNASAGAYYTVRYNSDGRIQFTESWAVPPSATPLKLKDVRVATPSGINGGTIPPPSSVTPVEESDVVGLEADLAARPMKGPGYAPSRVAYINEAGTLEAVAGSLTDCVRVDGTAGPCGAGTGAGPVFVDGETPAGLADGSNAAFTLASTPNPTSSLALHRNGILQKPGLDYTLSGSTVTFTTAAVPQAGDVLLAFYRLGDGSGTTPPAGLYSYPAAQVICGSTGTSTSSTSQASLGSCTIPSGLLQPGDRVDIRFGYSHEGGTGGFAIEVRWGGTTIASRSAAAGEGFVTGRVEAGVHAGGAQWSAQSWGTSLGLAVGAGNAGDSTVAPLVVRLLGNMTGSTSDTVTLRNFTVVRYPAQANP